MLSDTRRRLALRSRRIVRVVVAVLLVAAPVVRAVAAQGPVPPPPAYSIPTDTIRRNVGTLRPGDMLKIVVYRDEELSDQYLIDSRGYVQIPGLGVIRAAGLDPTEVHEKLQQALRARGFDQPELSVQPLIRVSVLGDVRSPALYPVEPGTSLIQLLTIAGGPGERANLRKTRVVRDGRAFTVDMESALAGSAAGRIVLYSNDVIVVPRKSGVTRETLSFALGAMSVLLSAVNVIVTLQR
jgi:polysaccharide biosynthesis/export protein